jgi:hypothetical protein
LESAMRKTESNSSPIEGQIINLRLVAAFENEK